MVLLSGSAPFDFRKQITVIKSPEDNQAQSDPYPTSSYHYGWVIVGVGFLIIFACIGLARYAYTMLLPSMQAGLGLPYDRMGFIGTGNFCGYLLSVILAPRLIRRFKEITGCPVLVNTSFNVRGEPIVCTPEDAFRCFMGTELDVLVVGNALLRKTNQSESLAADYKAKDELD